MFWDMRPVEFWAAVEGHAEEYDEIIRAQYETARIVSYYSVGAHLSKSEQAKGWKGLFQLPWEVKVKKPKRKLTKEEIEHHLKRMRRVTNWRTPSPDEIHKLVN